MIGKRAIAFDIGNKRIGVAISDPFNEYAMPCETYFRTRSFQTDVQAIAKIAKDKGVGVIVCGLPVNTDGTESEQTEKTRRFINALQGETDLPIVLEDERFTTAEAREAQMMSGVKQSRRKQTVDSIAASFILESYLKKQKSQEKEIKTMVKYALNYVLVYFLGFEALKHCQSLAAHPINLLVLAVANGNERKEHSQNTDDEEYKTLELKDYKLLAERKWEKK